MKLRLFSGVAIALTLGGLASAQTLPDRTASLQVPQPGSTRQACRFPDFPASLVKTTRRGTLGTTTLELETSAEGKILNVTVLGSAGHPDLDNAVISALSGCPANAAIREGRFVPSRFRLDYVWKLE